MKHSVLSASVLLNLVLLGALVIGYQYHQRIVYGLAAVVHKATHEVCRSTLAYIARDPTSGVQRATTVLRKWETESQESCNEMSERARQIWVPYVTDNMRDWEWSDAK